MRLGHLILAALLAATTSAAITTRPDPPPAAQLDALWRRLADEDWKQREAAAAELVKLGDDAASFLRARLKEANDADVRSRAEAVLRKIDEDRAVGPTRVTLRGTAVAPEDALAELARQAGATIRPEDDWQPLWEAPAPPRDLDFVRVPFWEAFLDITRRAGVEASGWFTCRVGDGDGATAVRVASLPHADRPPPIFLRKGHSPACAAGPFLLTATNGYFNLPTQCRVEVWPLAEPKLRGVYWQVDSVDEATDGRGVAFAPAGDLSSLTARLWADRFGVGAIAGGADTVTLVMNTPAEHGTALARLRGRSHAVVAVRTETLDVKGLAKDPAQLNGREWQAGPLRVRLGALEKGDENTWSVSATVSRGAGDEREAWWQHAGRILGAARPVLLDARDRPLASDGGAIARVEAQAHQGAVMGDEWCVVTLAERAIPTRFEGGKDAEDHRPGVPDRLVWELPTEVRSIEVPYDFRDVPLKPLRPRKAKP